eukprot:403338293
MVKEIISISLGPTSNFTSTHFWNFQDEWLKQDAQRNPVLFYETSKTQQFVPRCILVDFRPNFGNFLSCFSKQSENAQNTKAKEQVQNQLWNGSLAITEQEIIQRSAFQEELDYYDNQKNEDYEEEQKRDVDEDEEMYYQEDLKENFRNIMEKYKMDGQDIFGKNNAIMKDILNGGTFQSKYDKQLQTKTTIYNEQVQIDTSTSKTNVEKQPKIQSIQQEDKSAKEYYNEFKFDEQVTYFTDFMQTKMQPQNQLILPNNSSINEDNFMFYNQGKQLYDHETFELKDQIEDTIRNQLEHSDLLQGFNITCDVNSGFGSIAQFMIQDYIRDEIPKAQIILQAIRNKNILDEQSENYQVKKSLEELNQALWLSELGNLCNLVVPLENAYASEQLIKSTLDQFRGDSQFHLSGAYSLIVDNLLNPVYRKDNRQELSDLLNDLIYQDKPNIITAQMMLPYLLRDNQHIMKDLTKDKFQAQNFISFFDPETYKPVQQQNGTQITGTVRKQKVPKPIIPTRQTYLFRGTETLLQPESIQLSHFEDQFNNFVYKNMGCYRGHKIYCQPAANLLPIPFPRFFTKNVFNENGLIKSSGFGQIGPDGKPIPPSDEFIGTVPSLLRTTQDSSYLPAVQFGALDKLRNLKVSLKMQLQKEYYMEDEDIKEMKERLENTAEQLRGLNENYDASSSDGDDSHDQRYASDDY